ncbi:hypothetical protein ARMSODRAFT_892434, partial [Armillaria solidipes]
MSTITANFTVLSNVPKLDVSGTNWLIFHYRFEIAVESKGVWGHFNGSEPSPPGPQQGDDAATAAAATAEVTEWKKKEKEARHYLVQKLEDSTLTELLCHATVERMWNALTEKFTALSTHIIADMQARFDNMKCPNNGNVRTHLTSLRMKYEELCAVGMVLTDNQYATRIIGSLPYYYQRYLSTV